MSENRDFSGDPFISGAQLEVNFDEEGFRGSWYTATVLHRVSVKSYKKPHLQLQFQFHSLTAADREGSVEPLNEAVDLIPIPPLSRTVATASARTWTPSTMTAGRRASTAAMGAPSSSGPRASSSFFRRLISASTASGFMESGYLLWNTTFNCSSRI